MAEARRAGQRPMRTTTVHSHPLRAAQRAAVPVPHWPSYTGTSHFVGTSPSGRANVFVDPTLGQPGIQNAQDLVQDADRVATANDALFGTTGGTVNVIVFAIDGRTDGTGGADHMSCDYTTGNNIEVCAAFGQSLRVSALFEAELSECSMGGNLCGVSTGEALSRWCAAAIDQNALADFATGPAWVQGGLQDFVNTTAPTDQDAASTGCGMVFLSWLQDPPSTTGLMRYSLDKIAQAMVALGDAGTLAGLYAALTGDAASNAWPKFQAAVQHVPHGVTDDDPFGGLVSPPPPPPPPPPPSTGNLIVNSTITPGTYALRPMT